MVVGFNHNILYKGVVYHIQTEDSGLGRPNIITLLYYGGTILASRKTSYADIIKIDHLEKIVEDLMKEQHKGMLRSLKAGEFDEVISRHNIGSRKSRPEQEVPLDDGMVAPQKKQPKDPQPEAQAPPRRPEVARETVGKTVSKTTRTAQPSAAGKQRPTIEASLDEIILSYLMGDEK